MGRKIEGKRREDPGKGKGSYQCTNGSLTHPQIQTREIIEVLQKNNFVSQCKAFSKLTRLIQTPSSLKATVASSNPLTYCSNAQYLFRILPFMMIKLILG